MRRPQPAWSLGPPRVAPGRTRLRRRRPFAAPVDPPSRSCHPWRLQLTPASCYGPAPWIRTLSRSTPRLRPRNACTSPTVTSPWVTRGRWRRSLGTRCPAAGARGVDGVLGSPPFRGLLSKPQPGSRPWSCIRRACPSGRTPTASDRWKTAAAGGGQPRPVGRSPGISWGNASTAMLRTMCVRTALYRRDASTATMSATRPTTARGP